MSFRHAVARAFTLVVTACAACAACHKDGPADADASRIAAEPPVSPPDKLLAEIVIGAPDATWNKLQRGIGGALGILPATFGGIACAAAGFEPALASEVDGGAPAYGVLADDGDDVGFAFALRLVDPRHARSVLTEWETSRFVVRDGGAASPLVPSDASSIAVLRPRGGSMPMAAGLSGPYLLLARNESDLLRLGPYAYRTLPTRPPPTSAILVHAPHDALAGPLYARLAAKWEATKANALAADREARDKHGGRAPDFGDAPAIVAAVDTLVQSRLALLADMDDARLTIDADDDEVRGELSLRPAEGSGVAARTLDAMHPGDGAPLALVSSDASLALMMRDDAAARDADAALLMHAAEKILGARLRPDDGAKVRVALDDWAKGRGDWMTAALAWGATPSLALRTHGDVAKSQRAAREAVDLAKLAAFKEPLKVHLGVKDVSVTTTDLPGIGAATLATFARDGASPRGARADTTPPSLGVAWLGLDGDFDLVIAADAKTALANAARPSNKLGDGARIAAALRGLGENATLAFVSQPLAVHEGEFSAIVFGWGKKGREGWAKVLVSDLVLRELVKRVAGF